MSSEANFKKGACTVCAGHLEFPAEALGVTVACPHCGAQTPLLENRPLVVPAAPAAPASTRPANGRSASSSSARPAPAGSAPAPRPSGGKPAKPAEAEAAKGKFSIECPGCGLEVSVKASACPACGAVLRERSRFSLKLAVTSLVGLALVGGGILWATGGKLKMPKIKWPEFARKSPAPEKKSTDTAAPAPAPAPPPKPVKRSNVFKVVDYQIERTPGRSLVYVVGSVTNDTDKQQFSVRVTFDLFDRAQKPVGTATDYITVIEPGNGWEFRALILDTNAATAKLQALDVDKQ